jgi:hypothetical protein
MQVDSFEPDLEAILHFSDGVVNSGIRNDSHGEEANPIVSAVFFGEPLVVGPDHRLVSFIIRNAMPINRIGAVRKHDFGVHSVLVLLPETLLRTAGSRPLEPIFLQSVLLVRDAGDGRGARASRRSVFHDDGLVAIGKNHRTGRAIAPALRHARCPTFGPDVQVRISGNALVVPRHITSLLVRSKPVQQFNVPGSRYCPDSTLNLEL